MAIKVLLAAVAVASAAFCMAHEVSADTTLRNAPLFTRAQEAALRTEPDSVCSTLGLVARGFNNYVRDQGPLYAQSAYRQMMEEPIHDMLTLTERDLSLTVLMGLANRDLDDQAAERFVRATCEDARR